MNSTPNLVFMAIMGVALFASVMLQLQSEPSLLYIQDAQSGTFVPADDGDPTHFTLTLNTITPIGTYYSDRLDRITGRIRTRNFIRIEGLFENEDPPDAVIILTDPASPANENAVAVELYNPRHDPELQQLIYDVIVLDRGPTRSLSAWNSEIDAMLPEAFGAVRVIIDRASFQLDNILWTFEMHDASGQPVANLPLTLDYTTLSGVQEYKTRSTNDAGQVIFSLPSTFSFAALLTYTSSLESPDDLMIYAIPISARCSGKFNLIYGDEPAEGEALTLPCPIGN